MRWILLCVAPFLAFAQVQVTTYHNDNARTGQNLNEALLTPANVSASSFGKRFFHLVDGAILGQPLYLPSVNVVNKGLHNVVVVATAHDSVYAFDADDASGADATALWQTSFLDASRQVTAVPNGDVNCAVIAPEIGITGTPVIDAVSRTLYVVAETKEIGPSYVFRLHALDLTTGTERPGSPVVVASPGFNSFEHKQRGALLLSNGVVYVTFGANCDLGAYHGWVFGYDAATLAQAGVFNDSPGTGGSSLWNGGAGPAADEAGNVYVVSANGTFDLPSGHDYGESIIKLNSSPKLTVADYFTPFNQSYLTLNDIDLGSSGAVLLPDEVGSAAHPHLLVTAGKEGRIYLLDRDRLGNAQKDIDTSALASQPVLGHSAFGSSAYFNGNVFIASEYSVMRAYSISNGVFHAAPVSSTSYLSSGLGATPSISANGTQNGIVWMLPIDNGGALHAYDATDLSKQLYTSNQNPADILGSSVEFAVPTIVDGKAYVGTGVGLTVFGLTAVPSPNLVAATNAASFDPAAIAPGGLISLFGTGLALTTGAATDTPLPVSLTDISVTVNGEKAPLLYVSPTQINAQIPYDIAAGIAQIQVRAAGAVSNSLPVHVRSAAPGVFADTDSSPAGMSATLLPDPGSFVSLYVTGLGAVSGPVSTGSPAPAGSAIPTALPVTVTVGGVNAQVQFAGLAPGYVGVNQINLVIPNLPAGTYPVVVTVAGASSNLTSLTVGGN